MFDPFLMSLPLIPFAKILSAIGFGQSLQDDGYEIALRMANTGFATEVSLKLNRLAFH
jgi:hypothetical protein